jgi:hypothetical protein
VVLVRVDLLQKTRLVGLTESIAVYLCLGVYLVLEAVCAIVILIYTLLVDCVRLQQPSLYALVPQTQTLRTRYGVRSRQ